MRFVQQNSFLGKLKMLKSEHQELSETYGILARAFKRLRSFHHNQSMLPCRGRENPQNPHTDSVYLTDSSESGPETPEFGNSCPDSDTEKNLEDDSEVRSKVAECAFLKTRTVAWGPRFADHALLFCMTGKVRADRFRNYWVHDPTHKRAWRAVSKTQFREQWVNAKNFIEACQDILLLCNDRDTFEEELDCTVPPGRWRRKEHILEADLPYKTFLEFCREEHKRLPSLRG